jgi:hypothetical protein
VCADGHFAYTKCTCTTLSFLLDQFLGLLDGLSCCHYGGHLAAALVLSGGLLMMMMGLQRGQCCNLIRLATRSEISFRSAVSYVCAGTVSTCAR